MSHRVDIKTKITQKPIALKALQKKGWDFVDQGNSIRIQGGPMKGASINLTTGDVVGDSDWHDKATLGGLNQGYAEALVEDEISRANGIIQSRTVGSDGSVVILASMQLA
jgi:hypothetical protein